MQILSPGTKYFVQQDIHCVFKTRDEHFKIFLFFQKKQKEGWLLDISVYMKKNETEKTITIAEKEEILPGKTLWIGSWKQQIDYEGRALNFNELLPSTEMDALGNEKLVEIIVAKNGISVKSAYLIGEIE